MVVGESRPYAYGRLLRLASVAGADGINGRHRSAVPENFPLMRTLQLSIMAGAKVTAPDVRMIPEEE